MTALATGASSELACPWEGEEGGKEDPWGPVYWGFALADHDRDGVGDRRRRAADCTACQVGDRRHPGAPGDHFGT